MAHWCCRVGPRECISIPLPSTPRWVSAVGTRTPARRSPAAALTPKGLRQAAAVGTMLRARYGAALPRVTAVYTSPAVRAAGTAAVALATAGAAGGHAVRPAAALLEIDQGEWEDALRADVLTPAVAAAAQRDPAHHHAPGGESTAAVEERAAGFLLGRVVPDTVAAVAAAAAAAAPAGVNGVGATPADAAPPRGPVSKVVGGRGQGRLGAPPDHPQRPRRGDAHLHRLPRRRAPHPRRRHLRRRRNA